MVFYYTVDGINGSFRIYRKCEHAENNPEIHSLGFPPGFEKSIEQAVLAWELHEGEWIPESSLPANAQKLES
jgi:hypothetical protein